MKTTKTQFELFKQECLKLIEKWGIYGWRVDFLVSDEIDSRAEIAYSLRDRTVVFRFPKYWEDEVKLTDEIIIESARHETIHALTARIRLLAKDRFASEEEIYEANEEVARFIENAIKKGF